MIGGKAPGMQKTALLGLLAPGDGGIGAKTAGTHLAGERYPIRTRGQSGADQFRRYTGSLQITPDPCRPLAARRAVAEEIAGVALIIEEATIAQIHDGFGDFLGGKAALAQLVRQFTAGVVPTRKQRDGGRVGRCAPALAPGCLRRSFPAQHV